MRLIQFNVYFYLSFAHVCRVNGVYVLAVEVVQLAAQEHSCLDPQVCKVAAVKM